MKGRPAVVEAVVPVTPAPLPPWETGSKGRGPGKRGLDSSNSCPLLASLTCGGGSTPMSASRRLIRGMGPVCTASANVPCGDTLGATGNTGRGTTGPEEAGVARGRRAACSTLALWGRPPAWNRDT